MLVSGARVFLYINGQKIGRVIAFTYRSSTPKKAIYGLDAAEPYELAPTTTRVEGTVKFLRIAGDGGIQGMGAAAQYEDITREKYTTIALVDRLTQLVLFRADECSINSEGGDVAAKSFMNGEFSFEALSWSNELIRSS